MSTPASALPAGVYRIPLPSGLPVGEVNAYLLTGQVPTLIDPGPCTAAALAALEAGLAQVGLALHEVRQVILTHPHADHAGLAAAVRARSGARILAHHQAAPVLADPVGAIRRTVRFLLTWGERQGIPPAVLGPLAWGHMAWADLVDPVSVHAELDEGETLVAGDGYWRVLHTPGHSSGHICLLREEDGTLVSGDHLLPDVPSSPLIETAPGPRPERIRSGTEYLAALSRLALLDIRTVLPGHGTPFAGAVRRAVLDRIAAVRDRAEEAYRHLAAGPLTLWELCCRLFPRVHPDKRIFALSNVAGYLDLLAAQGRVASLPDGQGVQRAVAVAQAAAAGA